jgi:hypothetical protein
MQLIGKVAKGNEGAYGAKVFITNSTMSVFDKNYAVRTDADGKFKINAPTTIENGVEVLDTTDKFIAFESYNPSGKGIKPLEKGKTTYNFDTENFVRETTLPEFTITADKPVVASVSTKPVENTKTTTPKANKYWWVLPTVIGVACLSAIAYILIKNRKK